MPDELSDHLIQALAKIEVVGTYDGLDARVKEVTFEWEVKGMKAEGTFTYLSFRDGKITQNEFAKFISQKIIPFCLSRSFIHDCMHKLAETKDEQFVHKLVDEAKDLFCKAKKKNAKSGEPGEVTLFALLEGLNRAPRLVSKMGLKTNPNMEVHGSDAIHMKYDQGTGLLTIYWGESKLYGDLSSALDEIAISVKNFHEQNPDVPGAQRDFDINIIQSHADLDSSESETTREALLAYFDPYKAQSNNVREIHACLAMWDWDFCKQISSIEPEQAEIQFKKKYLERIETACSLFIDKLQTHGLQHLRFHLFLMPMLDIKEFRKQFCQMVGIPFVE